jgi:putative transcriptional regulator
MVMGSKDPARKEGFLEGKLLIALPGMMDPRFEKTVIFMCSHSDEGAMGLIVNKPIDGMPFQHLLEKLKIPITANRIEVPVMFGGPVETERGLVLHSAEYKSSHSTPLIDGIALTGSIDILHRHSARDCLRTGAGESSVRARLCRMGTGTDRRRNPR